MNNFKERITTTETDNDEYNLKEKYLNLFDKYGTYTYIFLFIGIVLSFFISKSICDMIGYLKPADGNICTCLCL